MRGANALNTGCYGNKHEEKQHWDPTRVCATRAKSVRILIAENDSIPADGLLSHSANRVMLWTGQAWASDHHRAANALFDLVILDLRLLRLSGLEVLHKPWQRNGNLPTLILAAADSRQPVWTSPHRSPLAHVTLPFQRSYSRKCPKTL